MAILKEDKTKYTKEEYFAALEDSLEKLEYESGVVIEMAGARAQHNRIKFDVGNYIANQLDGCRPFDSDQAVAVTAANCYYFPDLSFVCEKKDRFEDDNELRLINPAVIIEVLSKGTEARDRGVKFRNYWRIPTLTEYILIDSQSVRVDLYKRADDSQWTMRSYYRLDQIVRIDTLNVDLPMVNIYQRATF